MKYRETCKAYVKAVRFGNMELAATLAAELESLPVVSNPFVKHACGFALFNDGWEPFARLEINTLNGWGFGFIPEDKEGGGANLAVRPGEWAHVSGGNTPTMPYQDEDLPELWQRQVS